MQNKSVRVYVATSPESVGAIYPLDGTEFYTAVKDEMYGIPTPVPALIEQSEIQAGTSNANFGWINPTLISRTFTAEEWETAVAYPVFWQECGALLQLELDPDE
jgi:hypothetical protein